MMFRSLYFTTLKLFAHFADIFAARQYGTNPPRWPAIIIINNKQLINRGDIFLHPNLVLRVRCTAINRKGCRDEMSDNARR